MPKESIDDFAASFGIKPKKPVAKPLSPGYDVKLTPVEKKKPRLRDVIRGRRAMLDEI